MCSCDSILECCFMFSGVKLSMGPFVLFLKKLTIHGSLDCFHGNTFVKTGSPVKNDQNHQTLLKN